jgi:hypothetical protein
MLGGKHGQARGEAGLLGIGSRHQQRTAGGTRGEGGRQHALDRAQGTGQRQFAQAFQLLQAFAGQLSAGGQDAQRDGQVEATTVLV